MAGATRSTVVVLTSLLLMLNFAAFSSAEGEDVRFNLDNISTNDQPWFVAGDAAEFTPQFINDGAQTSVTNDPSCGVVLQVSDSTGQMLIDQSNLCRGQTQSIDLAATETYSFDTLMWDLKVDEQYVEPGAYTLTAYHPASQRSTSVELEVQTPVEVSNQLQISVEANSRLNVLQVDEEIVLGVTLSNPVDQTIDLPQADGCKMLVEINGLETLGMPCFGNLSHLDSYEQTHLGDILMPDASLNAGLNTVRVSFPGESLVAVEEFELATSQTVDTTNQHTLLTEISWPANADDRYGKGDILQSQLVMTNQGDVAQTLTFLDTCRAEMWVLDDGGDIVFDSRLIKSCNAIELDYILDANEQVFFTLPDWTFTDLTGCEVESGSYSVVVEVPQFHLSTMQTIYYSQSSGSSCASPLNLDITAEMSLNDAQGFGLEIDLLPRSSDVDLRWVGPCAVTVSLIEASVGEVVYSAASLCDDYDGRQFTVPFSSDSSPLTLDVGQIQMIDFQQQSLEDGEYQLVVQLEANPLTKAGFMFSWPLEEQSVATAQSSQPIIEETPRLLSGTWSGLQTEMGTCWMFESPQDGQLLLSSAKLGLWQPNQGWSGTYSVVNAPSHPACAAYQAPSFQILSLEIEQEPVVEQSIELEQAVSEPQTAEEQPVEVVSTVLIVVTSGSILSLLVAFVLGNESLRIPSTAAGLWLFGLLGRTHETSDGRYQRGRLMGYLTANPGCHFRALMAALEMSNGQITHHLRILEDEEGIWRRKDGRLVRYYPLTNALHPDLEEADLPVPPLSPDPNSLQGKILTLLDRDGPLGEFPTQAELAHRLEKSQQLVSHHLRTLQKFGLVEKRKMGLKNRYKLTREAIFLLESNSDFTRED